MPAHTTSAGKVLLSLLTVEELREIYPSPRLRGGTERATVLRSELEGVLGAIAKQGYATNMGESEDGVAAVSVPVVDRLGRPRAALSVVAPASRFKSAQVGQAVAALRRATTNLGERLV